MWVRWCGIVLVFATMSSTFSVKVRDGDIQALVLETRYSAIDAFVSDVRNNRVKKVRRLLRQKPSLVNARDDVKQTPIFNACTPAMIACLCSNGADVDARDFLGNTPLHIHVAAASRWLPGLFGPCPRRALMSLLKHGASPEARNHDNTSPLMLAICRRNYGAVAALAPYTKMSDTDYIMDGCITRPPVPCKVLAAPWFRCAGQGEDFRPCYVDALKAVLEGAPHLDICTLPPSDDVDAHTQASHVYNDYIAWACVYNLHWLLAYGMDIRVCRQISDDSAAISPDDRMWIKALLYKRLGRSPALIKAVSDFPVDDKHVGQVAESERPVAALHGMHRVCRHADWKALSRLKRYVAVWDDAKVGMRAALRGFLWLFEKPASAHECYAMLKTLYSRQGASSRSAKQKARFVRKLFQFLKAYDHRKCARRIHNRLLAFAALGVSTSSNAWSTLPDDVTSYIGQFYSEPHQRYMAWSDGTYSQGKAW